MIAAVAKHIERRADNNAQPGNFRRRLVLTLERSTKEWLNFVRGHGSRGRNRRAWT